MVLALLPLAGCGSSERPIPKDAAKADERQKINATLDEIEDLARELGSSARFRSIPVIVTKHNYPDSGSWGSCHRKSNGKGQYIAISRAAFDAEDASEKPEFAAVFQVLLHEIGHCYLNRKHDSSRIDAEDSYKSLPVSVMHPDPSHRSELFVANRLKKYYVGELLGLRRAKTPRDLNSPSS
jgi:hypothetical protein